MGNMILSYVDVDNQKYKYAFDSYEDAFMFLGQILKKNSRHACNIAYGKEGKGIYWHKDCLFAYGDDTCKELAGLKNVAIAPDEDIDYDDEDEDNPDFDEDVYYDNDTRL